MSGTEGHRMPPPHPTTATTSPSYPNSGSNAAAAVLGLNAASRSQSISSRASMVVQADDSDEDDTAMPHDVMARGDAQVLGARRSTAPSKQKRSKKGPKSDGVHGDTTPDAAGHSYHGPGGLLPATLTAAGGKASGHPRTASVAARHGTRTPTLALSNLRARQTAHRSHSAVHLPIPAERLTDGRSGSQDSVDTLSMMRSSTKGHRHKVCEPHGHRVQRDPASESHHDASPHSFRGTPSNDYASPHSFRGPPLMASLSPQHATHVAGHGSLAYRMPGGGGARKGPSLSRTGSVGTLRSSSAGLPRPIRGYHGIDQDQTHALFRRSTTGAASEEQLSLGRGAPAAGTTSEENIHSRRTAGQQAYITNQLQEHLLMTTGGKASQAPGGLSHVRAESPGPHDPTIDSRRTTLSSDPLSPLTHASLQSADQLGPHDVMGSSLAEAGGHATLPKHVQKIHDNQRRIQLSHDHSNMSGSSGLAHTGGGGNKSTGSCVYLSGLRPMAASPSHHTPVPQRDTVQEAIQGLLYPEYYGSEAESEGPRSSGTPQTRPSPLRNASNHTSMDDVDFYGPYDGYDNAEDDVDDQGFTPYVIAGDDRAGNVIM